MAVYTHGHHESVLRSHRWRTAENSAAYLLPALTPDARLLDVGCGPGTITADLATRVGSVTAVETAPAALDAARAVAAERGLAIDFAVEDVHALSFADDSFDVVHAHQVLQHVADPVAALREMARVCRPGGIVAARDSDYAAFTWWPEVPALVAVAGPLPRGSPGPTAVSPTRAAGCCPGRVPRASTTVTATSSTWSLRHTGGPCLVGRHVGGPGGRLGDRGAGDRTRPREPRRPAAARRRLAGLGGGPGRLVRGAARRDPVHCSVIVIGRPRIVR